MGGEVERERGTAATVHTVLSSALLYINRVVIYKVIYKVGEEGERGGGGVSIPTIPNIPNIPNYTYLPTYGRATVNQTKVPSEEGGSCG